jgi:general secretion pathway protein H
MRSTRSSLGFTLIELLVVLVIIGIMASFAVLQFGDRGSDLVNEESARLKTLIRVAREEAILQGREYALAFNKTGYAFYSDEEDSGDWQPVQSDPALRERLMPDELKLSLVLEDQLLELEKDLPKKPPIFIMSSGEITPFSISFRIEDFDAEPVELKFDALGRTEPPL